MFKELQAPNSLTFAFSMIYISPHHLLLTLSPWSVLILTPSHLCFRIQIPIIWAKNLLCIGYLY